MRDTTTSNFLKPRKKTLDENVPNMHNSVLYQAKRAEIRRSSVPRHGALMAKSKNNNMLNFKQADRKNTSFYAEKNTNLYLNQSLYSPEKRDNFLPRQSPEVIIKKRKLPQTTGKKIDMRIED